MGIRLSIGAGRPRLMRMLLTESLLLATLAGGISAYIAFEAPAIFAKLLMTSSMPVYQTNPDAQGRASPLPPDLEDPSLRH